MIMYLIRHGDTEATEKRFYYGSTDLPLSPDGRERLLALRSAGGYPETEGLRVYTSGMKRTEETLRILYGETEHEAVPELREMDFGDFEMKTYEQLMEDGRYRRWLEGDNNRNVCPNGESGAGFAARVLPALRRIIDRDEDCLLVIHGGVICCLMEELFPEEGKSRYDWQPEPGRGYTLVFDCGGVRRSELPCSGAEWLGRGYSFFQNRDCEFFPCHRTARPQDFNCLFCYCPLYALGDRCGGNFRYTEKGVKDCSGCIIPHIRENYGRIVAKYPLICAMAARKTGGDGKKSG